LLWHPSVQSPYHSAIPRKMMAALIRDLRNLGPASGRMLERAGIRDIERLRALGAVAAFLAVERAGAPASLNLLYALEGALTGRHWVEVKRTERGRLLIELDAAREFTG